MSKHLSINVSDEIFDELMAHTDLMGGEHVNDLVRSILDGWCRGTLRPTSSRLPVPMEKPPPEEQPDKKRMRKRLRKKAKKHRKELAKQGR